MSLSENIEGAMGALISIGKGCSLEPRKNGTYTIRFWKRINGKRHKKGFAASSTVYVEAISEARDLWKRWQSGTFDPWRDVYKRARVEEAISHYLQTRGKEIKAISRKTNEWAIRSACRKAGIKYIADLSPAEIRAIVYDRTLAEASKFSLYTKLRAVLQWMTDQGYFDRNPMNDVRKPKKPQRVPNALKPVDLDRFIASMPELVTQSKYNKKFKHPYWYVDGLLLALYTGATREELPRLRWGDVHWPDGESLGRLIIRRSKNQKDRPVSLILARALLDRLNTETRLSDSADEHILKAADGVSPISGPYLGRKCAAVSKMAMIKNVGLHGLRHTFAVNMIKRGVSMRSVQIMLGHDDITTTMIYTALTNEDVLEDVARAYGKEL